MKICDKLLANFLWKCLLVSSDTTYPSGSIPPINLAQTREGGLAKSRRRSRKKRRRPRVPPTGTFGWSTFQDLSETRFRLYQHRFFKAESAFSAWLYISVLIPFQNFANFQNLCTIFAIDAFFFCKLFRVNISSNFMNRISSEFLGFWEYRCQDHHNLQNSENLHSAENISNLEHLFERVDH